jgi:uncharacterized protein YbjT (DUF2867 family)
MTYLITGATGDVGSRVVDLLIQRGARPRVFVRDARKAQLRFGDRVDVFLGDLGDAASLGVALRDVDELFLVNSGPQIPFRDNLAAKAAKAAGVRHLVKLSSMDVQQGLAIGAWHEQGEAAIRTSGISFTFVQPSGFMSNLFAWAPSIRAESVVRASTGDGRRAFIHSDDIAAVAVKALTAGDYDGESLVITGPEALNFAEITAKIGAMIGESLTFQPISDDEARRLYSAFGAPSEETEAHVSLWRAIREERLATVTKNIERILGRKPIKLDQWVSENLESFTSQTDRFTKSPDADR